MWNPKAFHTGIFLVLYAFEKFISGENSIFRFFASQNFM